LDVLVVFPPSPGIHPSTSLEGPWLATLDPRLARVPPCLPASVGILPGVRMFCSPLPPWSSRRAPLALFPPGLPPHRLCWRPPGARVFRAPLPPWSFCRAPPWLSFGLSAPPPSLASPGTPRGFPIPWSLRDDKLCVFRSPLPSPSLESHEPPLALPSPSLVVNVCGETFPELPLSLDTPFGTRCSVSHRCSRRLRFEARITISLGAFAGSAGNQPSRLAPLTLTVECDD
jgi:hypothetical protein